MCSRGFSARCLTSVPAYKGSKRKRYTRSSKSQICRCDYSRRMSLLDGIEGRRIIGQSSKIRRSRRDNILSRYRVCVTGYLFQQSVYE